MEETYRKLNFYLNEICKHLQREDPFLHDNVVPIAKINDKLIRHLKTLPVEHKSKENHLTANDVMDISRDIVAHIDSKYLPLFDNLMESGEIDFGYEQEYDDSECISYFDCYGDAVREIINIDRRFNYDDVRVVIHEFFHYTNGLKESRNRYYLTEFLSIYFETLAIDYLWNKGIDANEFEPLIRLRSVKRHCKKVYNYEVILAAYTKFGPLDDNTLSIVQHHLLPIKSEDFENECRTFKAYLENIAKEHEKEIKENASELGKILTEEAIGRSHLYVLGTVMAFYAYKNLDISTIVTLNDEVCNHDDLSPLELCQKYGIDIDDERTIDEAFTSMDSFLQSKQKNNEK